ncbi:hypothetical protein EDB84DRAFT_1443249 [Lactarius hengduanensis]|nr:hypothetical protein EDB84DRAFT_1443249 [Lactarius hengduanensis]
MPRLSISVTSWYLLSIGPRPSFMNPVTWSALSHELLIGPLSELVEVGDFLRGARDNSASVFTPEPLPLLQQARYHIFNDPRLYVHARRVHDTSVNAIYEQAERNTSKKRKRKPEVVSELEDTPDLTALKKGLANIKSKSLPLPPEAAIFMRGPKNSDINTLAEIKYSSNGSNPAPQSTTVVVSVYNRLAWSYNVAHNMSCYVPTLLKISTMPYPVHRMRPLMNAWVWDRFVNPSEAPSGCVVVIEGTAYGDGSTETNYASLLHPHDPPSGYPLTTQITPPLLGNCRAIVAPVPRLLEISASVKVLAYCQDANTVMVIPLPKHEFGW